MIIVNSRVFVQRVSYSSKGQSVNKATSCFMRSVDDRLTF